MTIIHSQNVVLENMYVNSTDAKQAVGFDFSSLNVSLNDCHAVGLNADTDDE